MRGSASGAIADHWPVLALEALAVAGLALVVAWIVDPFWNAFARHLLPRRASADERRLYHCARVASGSDEASICLLKMMLTAPSGPITEISASGHATITSGS